MLRIGYSTVRIVTAQSGSEVKSAVLMPLPGAVPIRWQFGLTFLQLSFSVFAQALILMEVSCRDSFWAPPSP
jgi:hypothetical protein